MLTTISWQQYFICLLIALTLYYLFVWIILYKARIALLPGLKTIRQFSVHSDDEPDEMLTTVQHVIDEIKPLFRGQRNKNELLFSLQLQLKKYSAWEEPGFRETLEAFIAAESEAKCSIRLSEEDQRVLWQ